MEFILDTNTYRNLARNLNPSQINDYADKLIQAENSLGCSRALSIVVSMELIQHLHSNDAAKNECFKALCLQSHHVGLNKSVNGFGVDYYPPLNIILTKYFFNNNSKYFHLCQVVKELILKLTNSNSNDSYSNFVTEIKAIESQVFYEKDEFKKGIEVFIKSLNNGDIDWSFFKKNEKERDKLFGKINNHQIENLLAFGLLIRAHQIMDMNELCEDADSKLNQFILEFNAALKMNSIIFEKIGHGIEKLNSLTDDRWNTINDVQILFALAYKKGELKKKVLVTEDGEIIRVCTGSGLSNSILKTKDYLQLLGVS